MISNLVTALRIVLLAPLAWLIWRGGDAGRWLALGVFLLAGLTDVVDGRLARRLGEVSAAGALLDLIADRLLTLTTILALVGAGAVSGWGLAAAWVLVARDIVVASFGETLPGRLGVKVSPLERVKIAFQFLGLALLIAPRLTPAGVDLGAAGGLCLAGAALLALITLADYSARAVRALK